MIRAIRLRWIWIASLALISIVGTACKTGASAQEDDDSISGAATIEGDVLPDPFSVAQSWAESPTFEGLPSEVKERAESWKAGQVARIYQVTEGYRAVVHNYTTAQDAPAVLLTISRDASDRWRVVDAKLARSDHLWPEL